MKKYGLIVLFVSTLLLGNAQSFEVWSSAGAKYKLTDEIQLSASFSSRFKDFKARTLFPELTVKYNIAKWAYLSVDYRFVSKREDNGNYLGANRINMNAKLKNRHDRWSYALRIRYQMSSNAASSGTYNSDFDEALRFKPEFSYDIKNSIFTPFFAIEGFYNPGTGVFGRRIDKFRYTLGTDLELDGPHEISFFVRLDQKINSNNNSKKYIAGINYQIDVNKLLKGNSKKGEL